MKSALGTIKCKNPPLAQIEQLQSSASIDAGASTSKVTALQWQLPVYFILNIPSQIKICHQKELNLLINLTLLDGATFFIFAS